MIKINKIDWWIVYGVSIIILSKAGQYYSNNPFYVAVFGIYSILVIFYIAKEYKSNWIKDYIKWVKNEK